MNKTLILLSNDDGITSKGIKTLVEIASELGEVVVVAPDSPQSGMGHAISVSEPLMLEKSDLFGEHITAYQCSGTPADCVKLGRYHVLKGRKPDLVISGINHGSNISISVIYSGTMSAALEGAIEDVPAIGFSLCDFNHDPNFEHTKAYIKKIIKQVLKTGLPSGIALNVNFPKSKKEPLKGIKLCRQGVAKWTEEFVERKDPMGRDYFWMAGEFNNLDKGEDNDVWAIENNYVSIVPCHYDLTAYHAISILNKEWDV